MNNLRNDVENEFVVDVCVIGGGGAGLCAALEAVDSGVKKVILLEKTQAVGGFSLSHGGLFAVESPAQKRMGIQDTADECFSDLIKVLYWGCNNKLVRNWINGSGDTIRWLEQKGINFDLVNPFQGLKEKTRSTFHASSKTMVDILSSNNLRLGAHIARTLLKECRDKGVEVLFETRAQKLITDEKDAVVGVDAINSQGSKIKIKAKSTVIASGSISNNKKLIARFNNGDSYDGIKIMAAVPHNTGDGFIMAEEVGAAPGLVSAHFMGPHNHGPGYSEAVCNLIRRPYLIKVNRNGERFVDEAVWTNSDFGWMLSYAVDKQPGKMSYAIMDEKVYRDMVAKKECLSFFEELVFAGEPYPGAWLDNLGKDIQHEVAGGRAKVAKTLDEVAAWIGAEPEVLKSTVDTYNTSCKNMYDTEFLKDPRFLMPLSTPPYYIFTGPCGVDSFIGGISISHRMEVLNKQQRPIKGLYAAGVATSGWLHHGYTFYGSDLSYSLYSGRTAGSFAASYAIKLIK